MPLQIFSIFWKKNIEKKPKKTRFIFFFPTDFSDAKSFKFLIFILESSKRFISSFPTIPVEPTIARLYDIWKTNSYLVMLSRLYKI